MAGCGVRFVVDGEVVAVDGPPTTTLLQWLRGSGRTGTKEGCAEGDCGACAVAVLDRPSGRWRVVNACLVLLPMVDGTEVVTVQGLATGGEAHPVQAAMVDAMGSQCGYCTPGFVMTLFEACYRADLDGPGRAWKLDDQLSGNLCRCTGYRPIRDALGQVAGLRPDDRFRGREAGALPELAVSHGEQRFDAPVTLAEAVARLAAAPDTRIVCGATDLGLDVTQRHVAFPALLSVERVPELRGIAVRPDGAAVIGAATPLVDLEDWSADGLPVLHRMLRYFGSRPIKHRATLGGNLCNASPIGDLAPVLLALDAVCVAVGAEGEREIPLGSFFTGYRQTALRPGELLARVVVPPLPERARVGAYKVSRRRELDISAVAAGMRVDVDAGGVVRGARLGYGGVAATPVRARATEDALVGRPWTEGSVAEVLPVLDGELSPIDDHRGSAWFRRTLARNLLVGFQAETAERAFLPLPDRHAGTVVVG
ncbi:MAG: FAD binding domain-containing protein [Bryobacterales bacterium]